MEVSKDEISKLMMVGTKVAGVIQEIKRAWGHSRTRTRQGEEGQGLGRKKDDAVNKVAAEEDTPTIDAP